MNREKIIKAFDEAKELVWRDDDEYAVGYNDGLDAGKDIAISLLNEQDTEYEKGFNDAMQGKRELMYEGIDGKWYKKDW